MSVITPDRIIGGEVYERDISGTGLLRFEQCAPGEWLTAKGAPARKPHRCYMLNGDELDSVSSITGTIDKPALLFWYEQQTAIGTRKAAEMGELDGVPDEEIADRIKLLGLGASAARDMGADRGHAIHSAFEQLAREGTVPALADFPAVARPWVQGAARAWLLLAAEPTEIEFTVCHPTLGYAGRFDLIADCGGVRTLIDYKTGKGKVFDAAHYQTRLYAMALEHSGVEPVEEVVIVGVDDQGGARLVPCQASEKDARDLVGVFRSRKRINAAMAAHAKAVKAALKETA